MRWCLYADTVFASGCPRNRAKQPCDLCERMEELVYSHFVVPVEPDRTRTVSLPFQKISNGMFSNMPKAAQRPPAELA
jgi:hypothetical protein